MPRHSRCSDTLFFSFLYRSRLRQFISLWHFLLIFIFIWRPGLEEHASSQADFARRWFSCTCRVRATDSYTAHTVFSEAKYLWSLKWWRSRTGVTQYLHCQWNSTAWRTVKSREEVSGTKRSPDVHCPAEGCLETSSRRSWRLFRPQTLHKGMLKWEEQITNPIRDHHRGKKPPKRNGFHFLNGSSKTENSDS